MEARRRRDRKQWRTARTKGSERVGRMFGGKSEGKTLRCHAVGKASETSELTAPITIRSFLFSSQCILSAELSRTGAKEATGYSRTTVDNERIKLFPFVLSVLLPTSRRVRHLFPHISRLDAMRFARSKDECDRTWI